MKSKWKILIVSIVVYQIALTLILLKLSHYSHWLYFNGSEGHFPHKWYQGIRTTPMKESLLWLGSVLFLLIAINYWAFNKKEEKGN